MLSKATHTMSPAQAQRISRHVLGQLVCLGAHTVTGVLSACGRQFQDWSADYRMYGKERVEPEKLFAQVRQAILRSAQGDAVVAMDDTLLRKTGRKTHGVKYARDPMGPPFRINLIRAQRFVQLSMAAQHAPGQARMIPVDWMHAPMPPKPRKAAGEETWRAYRQKMREARVTAVGAERVSAMRRWLDRNGEQDRKLWVLVDGGYTNRTLLKSIPPKTTVVGRIRRDAKLHFLPPEPRAGRGRPKVYGQPAPTPEEMRQDPRWPWKTVSVFLGGKSRELRVKQLGPLRWRAAGKDADLQLLVIAPTAYRLTKNSKLLYRKPAYLICTDPEANLQSIVERYVWRWDIEVNFRDEKTLLGVGQAQVRKPASVQNATALAVAAYAMLLCAAMTCAKKNKSPDKLPAPKWQRRKPQRLTTMKLLQNLRNELCARAMHFSDFDHTQYQITKPQKILPHIPSALIYASAYS